MDINPRVENYAIFLKHTCSEKELHDMFGILYADEEVMDEWKLSEDVNHVNRKHNRTRHIRSNPRILSSKRKLLH